MTASPTERDREAARLWQESTCPNADVQDCCNCETCIAELAEIIAQARSEGDAAGYARGIEEAAKLCANAEVIEFSATMSRNPASLMANKLAAAIRSLLPSAGERT